MSTETTSERNSHRILKQNKFLSTVAAVPAIAPASKRWTVFNFFVSSSALDIDKIKDLKLRKEIKF